MPANVERSRQRRAQSQAHRCRAVILPRLTRPSRPKHLEKIMSNQTLTTEARNALMSARAKNRKAMAALIEAEVAIPKHVAAKAKGLEEWFNAQLAPAAKARKAA